MDTFWSDWLPLEALLALPLGEGWLALGLLALTASIYATGVPGTLLPLSFSSGALLGWAPGIATVGCGVMIGSLVLYRLLERGSQTALRKRFAAQLDRLDSVARRGGLASLVGLRLAGVPHLAVTALCALAAVGTRRYAISTMIGIFPAIALSATAGAAL